MVAILCLIALAVAFLAACGIAYAIYHAPQGRRYSMIAMWQTIDPPLVCPDCNGMGVVTFGKKEIGNTPGEFAHMIWAQGNNRSCSSCRGRGYVASSWPKPRPATPPMPPSPPP